MLGLEKSAKIMETPTPYNYKGARVHFVDFFNQTVDRLRCFRCHRFMPVDQFQPLFGVSPQLTGLRRSVRHKIAVHPHCYTCRNQERGKWVSHPKYSPDLDRFWQLTLTRIRGSVSGRGLLIALDKDDLLGLYLEQGGRCALTGLEMNWRAKGSVGRGKRALSAPSVDRIDSHGNYTLDNVQIVMSIVNVMKNDLPTDQFVALCEQVAVHSLSVGASKSSRKAA